MSSEWTNGEFRITTDPAQMDLDAIAGFMAEAYWAANRPREVTRRSLENSLTFGLFHGARQIGIARVVTDYATFAWLCDVFIENQFRGQGLGKWLLSVVLGHPELQGMRRWLLATRDAHELYRQVGFAELAAAERWMERMDG
jgi:GNAT superfamily N-acetyltransferase